MPHVQSDGMAGVEAPVGEASAMSPLPWEEDPGDRLARLKVAFVQDPCEERKEQMVAALHRYWRARNGNSGVGLLEEVAAMDCWADRMIEAHFRERR
jgi:hypothetical protein